MNNVDSKSTKDRIYDWVYYMCTHHNIPQIKDIPVMFTREYLANRYNISNRQIERILLSLVEEKKLYRYKIYNNIYIYSITPKDITKDVFVRVRQC